MDMALQKKCVTRLALAATVTAHALTACGGSAGAPAGQTEVRRAQPAPAMSNMAPGLTLFAGYTGGSGTLDGTGTSARFSGPVGIAIDPTDNLYVTDQRSSPSDLVLRKITSGGVVTTSSAQESRYSAFDGAGNRYFAVGHSIVKVAPEGTASTLAGVADSSGMVDGSRTNARMERIGSMVTDKTGNLFVINTKFTCRGTKPIHCVNHGGVIRKITPEGAVTTIAGSIVEDVEAVSTDGIGPAARFAHPFGMTIDAGGNLFVADYQSIRRISPSGSVTTLPRDPAVPRGSLMGDLLVGNGDTLFAIADGKLYRVATTGVMTLVAEFTSARLGIAQAFTDESLVSLAMDSAGNLFVASHRGAVYKLAPDGAISIFAGMPGFNSHVDGKGEAASFLNVTSITGDISGNLYVLDGYRSMRKIAPDGTVSTLGPADENAVEGRPPDPRGIAVAPDGTVYTGAFLTVRKLSNDGIFTDHAGEPHTYGDKDGVGKNGTFSSIRSMVADNDGNVYVAEAHSVRKVTPGGVVTTLAGSSTGGSADGKGAAAFFNFPSGIALDPAGNLYIADTDNATVRKLALDGAVTTVAGLSSVRGLVDGKGAAARFNKPKDMTADAQGNVYVIDSGTVRKITPDGVVTTIAGSSQFTGARLGELPGNFARLGGTVYLGANVLAVSDGTSVLKLAVP